MGIERTIKCQCGAEDKEKEHGAGFIGWGALHGIALNGESNPSLCPSCLKKVAEFLDKLMGG